MLLFLENALTDKIEKTELDADWGKEQYGAYWSAWTRLQGMRASSASTMSSAENYAKKFYARLMDEFGPDAIKRERTVIDADKINFNPAAIEQDTEQHFKQRGQTLQHKAKTEARTRSIAKAQMCNMVRQSFYEDDEDDLNSPFDNDENVAELDSQYVQYNGVGGGGAEGYEDEMELDEEGYPVENDTMAYEDGVDDEDGVEDGVGYERRVEDDEFASNDMQIEEEFIQDEGEQYDADSGGDF